MSRSSDADAMVARARLELENGNPTAARTLAERAVALAPANPGLAWNTLGRAFLELGDPSSAITAFAQATRAAPDNAFAWNNLGYARLLGDQPAAALDPIEKAISLVGDIAYMHNNHGVALERVGRLEDAHAAYSRAAALDPDHVRAVANAERTAALIVARGAVVRASTADKTPADAGSTDAAPGAD